LAMVWLGLKLLTLLALCKQHTDRWPDQKVLLLSCCRLGLMRELTASHSRQMLLMANVPLIRQLDDNALKFCQMQAARYIFKSDFQTSRL
jgi:hypothetical protein